MSSFTEVFAWGGDHFGQLGQGTQNTGKTYCVPRLCSFNIVIKELACGDEHTAFMDGHGYVYTMGSNSEGRLGVSDRSVKQSSAPCLVEGISKVVALACGWGHTAAVLEDGSLYTWGIGEHGALGLGTPDSQWQPTRVPLDCRTRFVSCGSRHTAIISSDLQSSRSLYTFGSGEAGQLGTGRRDRELSPVRLPCSEEIKQVSCGVFQTGFVTVAGKLFMTGGNSFGQLGIGTRKSANAPQRVGFFAGIPVAKVACGQHTAAVTEDGELFVWGTGAFGEFSTPQRMGIGAGVKDVNIGGGFGSAIDTSSHLWMWGSNSNGELGLGDYESRAVPTLLSSLSSKRVRLISCGGCYAIALGSDIAGEPIRGPSPNSSRNYGKSPIRPKTNRSPLRFAMDRPPIVSERGQISPFQRVADVVRTEEDTSRGLAEERRRLGELQRSEDRRRTEVQNARLEMTSMNRVRDLEEALKRKEIELAESRAKNDRMRLDSEESLRALETELQSSIRQNQSISADNQRFLRELEAKNDEITILKSANASLIDTNDKLSRECLVMQKTVEELQRRGEAEAKQRQDSSLMQTSRLRDDFQNQLQDLRTQLDQELVIRKQLAQDFELTTAHRRRLEESLNSYQQRIEDLAEEKRTGEEKAERREQEMKRELQDVQSASSRLESDLLSAQSQLHSLLQDLSNERDLTKDLQSDLSSCHHSQQTSQMLESAVCDLKFEVEGLHRKNNECMLEIDDLRTKLQDRDARVHSLKTENEDLRTAVAVADAKNRELFTNFERELTNKARDYRERTMTVLASPGNGNKAGNQHPVTPTRDGKGTAGTRFRGESPGLNLSAVSEKSPARPYSYRQQADPSISSPEAKPHISDHYSPPTFREGSAVLSTQLGVKSSINEIRDKLASLQQNKSVLEAKMRDFEKKIRVEGETRE